VSFTVVPVHNLDLGAGRRLSFGSKFVLQDVPEWLKEDKQILTDIGRTDRDLTLAARHALVSEYPADSLGFPDPEWKGAKARSIQKLRFQFAILANLAIWLVQPSQVCFTVGFHALTRLEGRAVDPPIIIHTEREGPFYCHPRDQQNPVSAKHILRAAKLYEKLEVVPRKNVVWAALRAFSAALLSYYPDYRYPLFWQGLESLFTSETKTWKVTERLAKGFPISWPTTRRTNRTYSIRSMPVMTPDPRLSTADGTKGQNWRSGWRTLRPSCARSPGISWIGQGCSARSFRLSATISLRRG